MIDMGGSHAWSSNGSFTYKRRWGALVSRRKRIYGEWEILTQDPPPALRRYLNNLGFVTEIDGKFCGVVLDDARDPLGDAEINQRLSDMEKYGLQGLVVVSTNSEATLMLLDDQVS